MKVTALANARLFFYSIPGRYGVFDFLRTGFLALVFSTVFGLSQPVEAAVFPDEGLDISTFDHLSTGFPLDGAHQTVDCESCHVGGVFEELSTLCVNCHDGVFTDGMPPTHIPVFDSCDICHTTVSFSDASANVMDHNVLAAQPCFNCHDGIVASGKSENHVPSGNLCDICHSTNAWSPVITFDHSGVIGQCYDCHNGIDATGKDLTTHINSTNVCAACHLSTSQWTIVDVDHGQVMGICSSCHNNVIAQGKGPFHIATNAECNFCHSTVAWIPAAGAGGIPDHSGFQPTECAGCHNGVTASGKVPNHINSTDMCDSCHMRYPANWSPVVSSAVDHNEVLGVCSSCHDNFTATGKGPTHIPTTDECDSCHSVTAWIPASGGPGGSTPDHSGFLPTDCAGCHNGVNASGKNSTHINSSNMCESCHQRFPANWAPVAASAVDHGEVIGICSSCHNNVVAGGKPPTHINTTNTCDACHQPAPATWAPVAASSVNHGHVIGTCVSCHNNSVAPGKSTQHLLTTDDCGACHQVPPSGWTPVTAATFDHAQALGLCSSCHDGVAATGKDVGHIPTTAECDVCHSTDAWIPAINGGVPDHSQFTGDQCFTCHDGVTASGKIATHISSTNLCDSCHQRYPSTWAPVPAQSVDHSQVIGTCASCHNNAPIVGKPANHPLTTDNCDICHNVPPLTWTPFITPLDHNEVTGPCVSCHDGGIAGGKSPTHINSTDVCEACHTIPPGSFTTNIISPIDHAHVIGVCESCHDGTTATGKTLGVHPTTSDVCGNCHSVPPTAWTNVTGTFSHADAFDTCATCHALPGGHCTPAGACDDCHNTTSWLNPTADCAAPPAPPAPPGAPPLPPGPGAPPAPPGAPPAPPGAPPAPPGAPPAPPVPPGMGMGGAPAPAPPAAPAAAAAVAPPAPVPPAPPAAPPVP